MRTASRSPTGRAHRSPTRRSATPRTSRSPTAATPKASTARRATIKAYFEAEVLPHVPDAWIDQKKTKVGYEIPFTRHFYKYVPPRPLAEIDATSKGREILELLREVEG